MVLEEVLAKGLEEALELVEGQAGDLAALAVVVVEEEDTEVVEVLVVLVVVVGLVEELDLVVEAVAQLVAVQ